FYLAAQPQPASSTPLVDSLREPRQPFYSPIPVLDEWPLSRLASMSFPAQQSTVATPAASLPAALKRSGIDRLQLTAWWRLRAQSPGVAGTQWRADGAWLGASRAGARRT